jgi:hypothetical protein
MTQALQLLLVVFVGIGLAIYGHIKGSRERRADCRDPRQRSLFPKPEHNQNPAELVTR